MEKTEVQEMLNSNENLTSEWIKSSNEIQLEKLLFHDASENFESKEISTKKQGNKRKAMWHDKDDEIKIGEVKRETKHTGPLDHLSKAKSYKEYLSDKFDRIKSVPKWADLSTKTDESNNDEELLASVGFLQNTSTETASIQPGNLNFKKLKDLNRDTYGEGSISSIQFHPSSTVALVAGTSGVASIYAIDGTKNEKLHNIRFNGYPIVCSRLYDGGSKALFGSMKNYIFSYDLMETSEKCHRFPNNTITQFTKFDISPCEKYLGVVGRFGEVHLLDLKSKEIIHTYKQEGTCSAIKFAKNSERIFTHSNGAYMNILNVKTNRIEHSFVDEGCVHGKCLDISPSGTLLASGSKEGVVNLYNFEDLLVDKHPKPIKTIYNLTTAISDVKFNSTSEILGLCSDLVPGAVKLVHCATGEVFSNFPGFQNKLNKIKLIEFSPSSGYMALGSSSKEAPLYRLKHFNNY